MHDLVWVACGDDASLLEDHYLVRYVEYGSHDVLDNEHREMEFLVQFSEELDGIIQFFAGKSCEDFVNG